MQTAAKKAVEKRRARDLKKRSNVRTSFPCEDDLLRLGRSVIARQIHPLVILTDGSILDGECRHKGVMLIDPDHELDCIAVEREPSPAEICELQLISAMHRNALTPFEQAMACLDWKAKAPDATAKQLADRLDRDASMIGKLMTLGTCIPAVVDAAREGKIGPAHWSSISLVPAERQAELLMMALAGGNAKAIGAASLRMRNGSAPAVRVGKIKCPLPSGATIQITAPSITLDDAIEAVQEWLKEAKRASEQGLDAKTLQRVMGDKAKVR